MDIEENHINGDINNGPHQVRILKEDQDPFHREHTITVDLTDGHEPPANINFDEYDIIESGYVEEVNDYESYPEPPESIAINDDEENHIPESLDAPGTDKVLVETIPDVVSLDAPTSDQVYIHQILPSDNFSGVVEVDGVLHSLSLEEHDSDSDLVIIDVNPEPMNTSGIILEDITPEPEVVILNTETKVIEEDAITAEIDVVPVVVATASHSESGSSSNLSSEFKPESESNEHSFTLHGSEPIIVVEGETHDADQPIIVEPLAFSGAKISDDGKSSVSGYSKISAPEDSAYAIYVNEPPQSMSDDPSPPTVVVYSHPGPIPQEKILDKEGSEFWFKQEGKINISPYFAFACLSCIINLPFGIAALCCTRKARKAETVKEAKKYAMCSIFMGFVAICLTALIIVLVVLSYYGKF